MYDRLLFTDKIEREGTKEIIHDNFPSAFMLDLHDTDILITDLTVKVPEDVFFEWAYLTPGAGQPIIMYCLTLSVQLLEPPDWMTSVLTRLLRKQLMNGDGI